jgi:hypothetical protein
MALPSSNTAPNTTPNTAPESKVHKETTTQKAMKKFHKFRGKDSHQPLDPDVPPAVPTKHQKIQPATGPVTPNKEIAPNGRVAPIAMKGVAKDEEDIKKLQREFRNMQREMSTDNMEAHGEHQLALMPFGSQPGHPKQSRQVMSVAQVPLHSNPEHNAKRVVPSSTVQGSGSGTIAATSITRLTMVTEPDIVDSNIPERKQRRVSMSQPTQHYYPQELLMQGHEGLPSQPVQTSRKDVPTNTIQNMPSLEKLRSQLEVASLERQQMGRDLENMRTVAREKEAMLDSMQKTHVSDMQELNNMRMLHERDTADFAQLQNDNAELQATVLSWQSQFDLANKELLRLKSDLGTPVSDKWFQNQWNVINNKIEMLSNQFFLGRLARSSGSMLNRGKLSRTDKLEEQPAVSLTRLSNDSARYLCSEQERPLIIQALIWYVLVNRVFAHTTCDDGGFYWAGQSRELLYHLKRQVRPPRPRDHPQPSPPELKRLEKDARDYHNWRADTAMLLLARSPLEKRIKNIQWLFSDIIADILVVISPFIAPAKGTSIEAAENSICQQLESVLVEAVKTDAEMVKQRAWIYCEQWRSPVEGDPLCGFQYNEREMAIVHSAEQVKGWRQQVKEQCVEMVLQPALFREGNQYGEDYAVQHVLCKAKVTLGDSSLLSLVRR